MASECASRTLTCQQTIVPIAHFRGLTSAMDMHERLILARQRAGYEKAIDAINAFGFNRTSYYQHENGNREYGKPAALRYAKAFRVTVDWLLFGRGSGPSFKVPIVGFIGAGGQVAYIDDHAKGGGLDEIEAPPGCPPGAVAVVVRGDSMATRYPDGRVVIYWDQRTDISSVVGEDCVVRLTDGRTMLKTVMASAKRGRWTLLSTDAPLMQDVELEWAAPVEIVLRRRNWNQS